MDRLLLTPGGMMPAGPHYEPLLQALGTDVEPLLKDFELYSHDAPPDGYGFATEVEGLRGAADAAGWDTFHLIGYSTCLPIAFVARHPERVRTVAMVEPGMLGNGAFAPADMVAAHVERVQLPIPDQFPAMVRSMLAPGVKPPPPPEGPPPPWMAHRMVLGKALMRGSLDYDLGTDDLRAFDGPVLIVVGSDSHPSLVGIARAMAEAFPDGRLEIWKGRHHLDPAHRAEPDRFAAKLKALWRGEPTTSHG